MASKEKVQELSSGEFSKVVGSGELTIVSFYTEACMPCLMMDPILGAIADKHSDVKFGRLNIDEEGEIAEKYGVSSVPCIIFFKGGKEDERVLGTATEEELEDTVKRLEVKPKNAKK